MKIASTRQRRIAGMLNSPSMRLAQPMLGYGQGGDLDALVAQLFNFVRRGSATNSALGRFLVMYLARLLRETVADVLRVCNQMLHQLRHFARHIGVLLALFNRALLGILGGFAGAAGVYIRRMQCLINFCTSAHGAAQQSRFLLAFEIGRGAEPPLKAVIVSTCKVKDNHCSRPDVDVAKLFECRCSQSTRLLPRLHYIS